MTLEEQLKDLQEKLDMTQAIKHGGQICDLCCSVCSQATPETFAQTKGSDCWQLTHLRNSSLPGCSEDG